MINGAAPCMPGSGAAGGGGGPPPDPPTPVPAWQTTSPGHRPERGPGSRRAGQGHLPGGVVLLGHPNLGGGKGGGEKKIKVHRGNNESGFNIIWVGKKTLGKFSCLHPEAFGRVPAWRAAVRGRWAALGVRGPSAGPVPRQHPRGARPRRMRGAPRRGAAAARGKARRRGAQRRDTVAAPGGAGRGRAPSAGRRSGQKGGSFPAFSWFLPVSSHRGEAAPSAL